MGKTALFRGMRAAAASLLLLAWAVAPSSLYAHAEVAQSAPAAGASVPAGLTEVVIVFTEEVSVEQTTAELVGGAGTAVAGVTAEVNRADRTRMTVSTPALGAGSYTVKWRAVTEDDNSITSGTVQFNVAGETTGASSAPATGGETSQPVQGTLPSTGGGPLLVVVSAAVGLVTVVAGALLRRQAER